MKFRFSYIFVLAIVATTLTSCPEGAISEGVRDEVCEHNYSYTHWKYENSDSVAQLDFIACNVWQVTCNDNKLTGFYTIRHDTISGGVTDGKDSLTIAGFTKGKNFSGMVTDEGKTLNINNIVFKRQ